MQQPQGLAEQQRQQQRMADRDRQQQFAHASTRDMMPPQYGSPVAPTQYGPPVAPAFAANPGMAAQMPNQMLNQMVCSC